MGQFLLHGSAPPSLPPALLSGDLAEGCILRGAPTCSKLCPCPPSPTAVMLILGGTKALHPLPSLKVLAYSFTQGNGQR